CIRARRQDRERPSRSRRTGAPRRRAARQPRNRRIRLVNEGFTRLLLRFRGRSAETASITMASGFYRLIAASGNAVLGSFLRALCGKPPSLLFLSPTWLS